MQCDAHRVTVSELNTVHARLLVFEGRRVVDRRQWMGTRDQDIADDEDGEGCARSPFHRIPHRHRHTHNNMQRIVRAERTTHTLGAMAHRCRGRVTVSITHKYL